MQEKREYPRKNFNLPVTVRLPHQSIVAAKMVELSMEGMRLLCPIALEINSEVELLFSPPSEHTHEIRLKANVRHLIEVHVTSTTPLEYRYAVGVNFTSPQEHERMVIDEFLKEL